MGTTAGPAGCPTEETPVRKKLVLATTAGALTLTGLAVTVPAMAEEDTSSTTTETTVEDRIRDALSGLVDDGSITQDQADQVATTLSDAGPWGGHGPWGGPGRGVDLSVAADTLGMSEDDLETALEADGASLASVAEDHGVAVDDLVAALVQSVRDHIDEAVQDGDLTQEQADQRIADVQDWITERVNSTDTDPGGPRGPHGWWGDRDGDDD
jgi:polyhydroxyalkanoate synthesis regulator phasin